MCSLLAGSWLSKGVWLHGTGIGDEEELLTDEVGDEQKDIFRVSLGCCQIYSNFGIDVLEGVLSVRFAGDRGAMG